MCLHQCVARRAADKGEKRAGARLLSLREQTRSLSRNRCASFKDEIALTDKGSAGEKRAGRVSLDGEVAGSVLVCATKHTGSYVSSLRR